MTAIETLEEEWSAPPTLAARVTALFRRAATAGADALLPPVCLSCRHPVADHGALCVSCWSDVGFITKPVCERLGVPLAFDIGPGALSAGAIADPPAFDRARAAFRYDGVGRHLVVALKFADRQDVAPALARWMAAAGKELLDEADVIAPVPLHWTRLFRRRFNQAAEIARHVAARTEVPFDPMILTRRKRTARQLGLTRAQRLTNVQGAFLVRPEKKPAVEGRRVLLIDDVFTTGATVDACTRALRRAGATHVDVLTAARVVEPGS